MKRFWLVLLSLGLIAAFSTSAMAVDVKFSGEFFAAGMYQDKTTLVKGNLLTTPVAAEGPSTAFYFQRLRLRTDFVVSPGLTLTTRLDMMERAWGANRTAPGTSYDLLSAGTRAENENIAIDLAYLTYASPIGIFSAGYLIDGAWGTVFADNSIPTGKITYTFVAGGLAIGLQTGKNNNGENSAGNINGVQNASDRDSSFYTAFVNYTFQQGVAGILYKYIRSAATRAALGGVDDGYLGNYHVLLPYFKVKLGPVFIQGEFDSAWGQFQKFEGTSQGWRGDTRIEQYAGWIDATADFGKAYVGGTVAYVGGDDPGSGALEGGIYTGGNDWQPCLIMFNSERNYWAGAITGFGGAAMGAPMTNAWFFQGKVGVRPVDKLDIMATVAYANADKKPTAAWLYNDYGWEVDLTATYKITNNLSYMLGGGYLFTGKYWQADQSMASVKDNYMLINKLTLTF